MLELLVSGVQHHQRRWVVLPGAAKFPIECSPSTLEQQAIEFAAVTKDQRRKFVRQREDDLEVRHAGHDHFGRLVHPVSSPRTAALRTVPVAARVVNIDLGIAAGAFVNVSLENRRATEQDF